MNDRGTETIFGVNTVIQSIFNLLTPPAAGALISWFLCSRFSVGGWIYAVLIPAGVIVGLISAINYILTAAETQKAVAEARKREREDTAGIDRADAPAEDRDRQDGSNG